MTFSSSFGWRRSVFLAGAVAVGAVGAGGLALAEMPSHDGWRHGPRLGMIQQRVRQALDAVGATAAQEDKVHDIVAAAFADTEQDRAQRLATRKQMLDLLGATTIDRAAVEKLRSDRVARFDARSKKMEDALLDAADQLTPEQRGKLVARFEQMMENRDRGQFVHDREGAPGDRPRHGRPGGD